MTLSDLEWHFVGVLQAHMFMPHFDRHLWIYRDNPIGVFSPFNPAVTCQHHTGARTHSGH